MTTYGNSTEQDEFQSELMYNMLTLQNNLELIENKNDRKFAGDLCRWYDKHGQLSPKQTFKAMQFWQQVNSLGAKQSNPSKGNVVYSEYAKAIAAAPAKPKPVVQVDGSKMIAAFDKAAEKLKYPHITYYIEKNRDGPSLVYKFYRTGFNSKKPGTILITDGCPYPQGKIYAQILRDGTVVFNEILWGAPEEQQRLKKIIEDFVNQFAINGKEYSTCCYCGRELTDPASVYAGYGPICADNYGLPWGEVPEKEITLDIL